MSEVVIKLSSHAAQTRFNLRRWAEIHADPIWERWEGKLETDRNGLVIMSPPAGFDHASYGFRIGSLLQTFLNGGRALTECPISTADGVRTADVAWISKEQREKIARPLLLMAAPEICVEVLSKRNTKREMAEKKALYFAAGALEVWFCNRAGRISFFTSATSTEQDVSLFCPEFPVQVELE